MQVSGISNPTSIQSQGSQLSGIGQSDFFTLLTTQLKAQNPLEPMDNQQFLQQMVSLASLEQNQQVNVGLQNLASLQEGLAALDQLTQGANLIGHPVEYLDPKTGEKREGTVAAVRVQDGLVQAEMEDKSLVPLALIQAVKKDPA
ncbi:MAG: flagellar hook capping FlgD N-terminal domain-containing protein [Planctomycetota bacterium]